METIVYHVMQKAPEQRLIDAACIYWEVDRAYFNQKKACRLVTYRKAILYYLIRTNTGMGYKNIAELFGFRSHQAVLRLVEGMDCLKDVMKGHAKDINEIQGLADKMSMAILMVNEVLPDPQKASIEVEI